MLERRCWLLYSGRPLYPNLYAMLVGPPGVGKTMAIVHGREVLEKLGGLTLAPQMTSKEKFIRQALEIAVAKCTVNLDPSTPLSDINLEYTCAFPALMEELGTFIRQDEEFMRVLTDLYDCPENWHYKTKSQGEDHLKRVYINILGGITTASLANDFGEIALNMGFLARFILVYCEQRDYVDPFSTLERMDPALLAEDLRQVRALEGAFQITEEAKNAVRRWLKAGLPPLPGEVRLSSYNARREIHWMKLAMLTSVSESNSMLITEAHVEAAKTFLLTLEEEMPKALQFFGGTNNSAIYKQLHRWAIVQSGASRTPIPERILRLQLVRDVPPQYHDQTLETIVGIGLFSVVAGAKPARQFLPVLKGEEPSE